MKTADNDRIAHTVLRCLYTKPIGVNVPNIRALKSLCKPKLDAVDDKVLANIVAGSPAGLRGLGLVTCTAGGTQGHLFGALDIDLTDEGRAWVLQHSRLRFAQHVGAWLVEHVAAAVISAVIAGALAGGLGGWFLRGWLKR